MFLYHFKYLRQSNQEKERERERETKKERQRNNESLFLTSLFKALSLHVRSSEAKRGLRAFLDDNGAAESPKWENYNKLENMLLGNESPNR